MMRVGGQEHLDGLKGFFGVVGLIFFGTFAMKILVGSEPLTEEWLICGWFFAALAIGSLVPFVLALIGGWRNSRAKR